MVGGTVIELIYNPDKLWVNVQERQSSDTCAIYIENDANAQRIKIGDSLWWQGDYAMWTPEGVDDGKCGVDYDIKILRIGYSGVHRPE